MAFLFNPCSPCCNPIVCDGYAAIDNSCSSTPSGNIFPSYLNVGTGDLIFVLLDVSGNIISSCYPLLHSGVCEFQVKQQQFFTSGGHNNPLNLVFASGLNTPTISGYINCYPSATGLYQVNSVNYKNIAYPCWIPSGINVSFTWNLVNGLINATNGLNYYYSECDAGGGIVTGRNTCANGIDPTFSGNCVSAGDTLFLDKKERVNYSNVGPNPITALINPTIALSSQPQFLYRVQFTCSPAFAGACSSRGSSGSGDYIWLDNDIYITFQLSHDCNKTSVQSTFIYTPHGSSCPVNLTTSNSENAFGLFSWSSTSGVTSCSPLLMSQSITYSAQSDLNPFSNCYNQAYSGQCGFNNVWNTTDSLTLSQ